MKCACCKRNDANKENTHYLTDGIIRSCLNLDGSNKREKGFYFDLSNDKAFIEFNFQQGTSVDKLQQLLGRDLKDDEIEKAKNIPFSVDYVFCIECEKMFTDIETKFQDKILPKFRKQDLSKTDDISFGEEDSKLIRLFFCLQLWRAAICNDTFQLPNEILEDLRNIILNYNSVDNSKINHYQLAITHLETTGGADEYTYNLVGFTSDKNPSIIFMNDFVIQLYIGEPKFFDFYGLTDKATFMNQINYLEKEFKVHIMHNKERRHFYSEVLKWEKAKQYFKFYSDKFSELWFTLFGHQPSSVIVNQYMAIVFGGEFDAQKFSAETVQEKTLKFLQRYIRF